MRVVYTYRYLCVGELRKQQRKIYGSLNSINLLNIFSMQRVNFRKNKPSKLLSE